MVSNVHKIGNETICEVTDSTDHSNIDSYCLLPKSYLTCARNNECTRLVDTTDLKEIESIIETLAKRVNVFLTRMKKFLNSFIPNIGCE